MNNKINRTINLGLSSALSLLALAATTASAETITIQGGFPEMVPFYERVAASLKKRMPDLEIKIEAIGLRDHEKRVALGLRSKSGDTKVIELTNSTATRYIENDLLPAAPKSIVDFVTDTNNFDSFFADAASFNGKVYGVPVFRGQGALFYNLDMFKAAGLSSPPKTMDEYTEYAQKLTQRDGNGNPTVSGWSLRLAGGGAGIAEKFWINLFQFGGNVLEPTSNGKWRAGYANAAGRSAVKQYLDSLHTHNMLSMTMPADAEAFQRGETAMFIREAWVIGSTASKAPNLNYATAPLPVGSIVVPVNLYVSNGDSKAAWEFTKEANKPEHLIWMLDNIGWLPNRNKVDFSGIVKQKPQFAAFVDVPSNYKYFTLPAIGPISDILTRFAERLTRAFDDADLAGNDAAIDEFLKEAAAETNKILERDGLLGS